MVKRQFPLEFQWKTQEPFLFCVHHLDVYPQGESNLGPHPRYREGRNLGQDFQVQNGFRMYHGEVIPGFPVHPHRGFETITIVRKGFVDHSDSLGAAGRYGDGDVQWMTAGAGVQHSEMFPLLKQDSENTLELFQIWLNLPKKSKLAKPDFKMFWKEKIPTVSLQNGNIQISVIAGNWRDTLSLSPPPESLARNPHHEIQIWLIKMKPHQTLEIPGSQDSCGRTLYVFKGKDFQVSHETFKAPVGLELESTVTFELKSGDEEIEVLVLQAKPLKEPLVQYGPFVMNTKEEIMATIADYQQTQFGGWPWPEAEMTHGKAIQRFARYPDGRVEKPDSDEVS